MMNLTSNHLKYSGRRAALAMFNMLFSTTVVHGFLLSKGLTYSQIGMVGIVEDSANILCMFFAGSFVDRFQNFSAYRKTLVTAMMIYPLRALALAVLFHMVSIESSVLYGVYLAVALINMLVVCFAGMMDISLIVRITDGGNSTVRLSGISGLAAGAASIAAGLLVSLSGANIVFISIAGLIASFAAIACTLSIRASGEHRKQTSSDKASPTSFKAIIRLPAFRALLPSNLLRALQFGSLFYAASIGITRFAEHEAIMGWLAFAASAAPLVAYYGMLILGQRTKPQNLYLAGTIIAACSMLLLSVCQNAVLYAAGYFLLYVGEALIDECYPLGMYQVVPIEQLGSFSAFRMVFYYLTSMCAISILGKVLENSSAWIVFVAGAIFLVAGGASFAHTLNKRNFERRSML